MGGCHHIGFIPNAIIHSSFIQSMLGEMMSMGRPSWVSGAACSSFVSRKTISKSIVTNM